MTMYPGGSYGYGYSAPVTGGEVLGLLLGVYLFILLLLLAVSVVFYVLQSVSFYAIAKRRGIRNPWLSWIPGGNLWILGSISDQYQYVKQGRVKNRRKILLGLYVAYLVVTVIYMILAVVLGLLAGVSGGAVPSGMLMMGIILFAFVMMAVGIAMTVYLYIALYDLYASCDPSNAVIHLLLSVLINVTMPFLLFSCRKRDEGMPPRRDTIPQQPAAPQPYPGWIPAQRPIVFPTEPTVPIAEETVVPPLESAEPTAVISEETAVLMPEDAGSTATLPEDE